MSQSYKTYPKGTPLLITTENRGVFFGRFVERLSETTIVVDHCRNIVFWPEEVKGFLNLAIAGPNKNSRVTPKGTDEMEILKITSVTQCTKEAVIEWEKDYWSAKA